MATMLQRDMQHFGRLMVRWRLQVLLLRGVAGISVALAALGLLDFVMRTGRTGRWFGASLLLAGCVALVVVAIKRWRRSLTPDALAVSIERYYPELDNRLINFVQFTRSGMDANPLIAAYVSSGAPALGQLEVRRMKDERAYRQSALALGVGLVLLITPGFFLGSNWTTAIWRMVNPVSALEPVTLTRIVSVEPGDTDVMQGAACLLVSRVQGARGHAVRVEVDPDDGRPTTYELGALTGAEAQTFSHRVARVNTHFRYWFRAGDAVPSAWYSVTPRPPPALTVLRAQVRPPAYTRIAGETIDLRRADPPTIPVGSEVTIQAGSATPLESLHAALGGSDPVEMGLTSDGAFHEVRFVVEGPGSIQLTGVDRFGQTLKEMIEYRFLPDQPPVIQVLEPTGRTVLPPGEPPLIVFRVEDDYALGQVYLERVGPERGADATPEVVMRWDPAGRAVWEARWRGGEEPRQAALSYRVVAVDAGYGDPRITRSEPIQFSMPSQDRQAAARDRLEAAAATRLEQVIALQEQNLSHSTALRAAAGDVSLWQEPMKRQEEIRTLTRELLQNPIRPLGGRTESVGRIYANEMRLAVHSLEQIPQVAMADRDRKISEALTLQSRILRQLQAASLASEKAQIDRRKSGIVAMLHALLEGQSAILEQAAGAAGAAGRRLANRQDRLSEDVGLFELACEREAAGVRANDAAFAALLDRLARESRERRIRQDMLLAAERLEDGQVGEAMPLGKQAHASLKQLQALLDQVGLQQEEEQREAMLAALGQAQERMKKLIEMHQGMQDAMDMLRGHRDEDSVEFDVMMEEFVELVKKNKEALLQIPVDLHVFMDLNVGNELVEDVFSVFQEIEQVAGSENQTAEDVMDVAFAKNLEALELMREAEDLLDGVEFWLAEEPSTDRVLTEALDREEMPEAGIALGALAAQLDDLISDLMEQSEEAADAADDGATTHAGSDLGWEVMEGDRSSFDAVGKSGNEAPDHKEQDGRSNVGRQGMASGETAAGSGTIGEGDDDIEARRTEDPAQSGMVQLDGEADTAATGGGKLGSGKADDFGMEGGTRRMDSTEEGSAEGMAALMARSAEALFAQASMRNVRVDSLKRAAHHLRQADDAVARGDIRQMVEHRNRAEAALMQARAELAAPPSGALQIDVSSAIIEGTVQAGPDVAPARYRAQVADYFKFLNEDP